MMNRGSSPWAQMGLDMGRRILPGLFAGQAQPQQRQPILPPAQQPMQMAMPGRSFQGVPVGSRMGMPTNPGMYRNLRGLGGSR